MSAPQRRQLARYLTSHYPVSVRQACRLSRFSRAAFYREPAGRQRVVALRLKLRDLAHSRIRYGYKRVHRLYCLEGLQIKAKRPRRHVSAAHRQPPRVQASAPNVAWSMGFVSDQTAGGQRFRALLVVDVFTRECLAIEPGQHLGAADVVRTLSAVTAQRRAPRRIYCENGSKFAGRLVDL